MNAIFVDPTMDDATRRQALYDGQLVVYSPRPTSLALSAFAREMSEQAFGSRDPRHAQHSMSVEDYAATLATLKPKFIHHPRVKDLMQTMLRDFGCDPEKTYFDVPRLRTATAGGYLTSGIAYAFHPHRDTWYSAPFNQINWWIPVYDIEPNNAMAFHLRYWDRPVRNGSRDYNYAEWTRTSRVSAAEHIKSDTRPQPKAEEPVELDPQVRLICRAGGVILFSSAHLHSTVPNTTDQTRFSIDFRTVHAGDVRDRRGARNVDSACTGTTMGDYLRVTDLAHLPSELIDAYEREPSATTVVAAGAPAGASGG
jgi:Phytanoyl-CoA dioxygenase (PhyH)